MSADLLRSRVGAEGGFALVMAIVVMAMLSLGLATSIVLTTSGEHHAYASNGNQKAYALAEDGLNNATAVIFANDPPANLTCMDASWDAYKALLPARTTTRPEGSVTWSGVFTCGGGATSTDGKYWTITSVATVPNANGAGMFSRRVIRAKVPFQSKTVQTMTTETVQQEVQTISTWTETVYVPTTSTRTITNTSTTFDDPGFSSGSFYYSWGDINSGSGCPGGGGTGGAAISTSIITEGNFCLTGGSAIVYPSASVVSVRGSITLDSSANGASIGLGPATPPQLVYAMTAADTGVVVSSANGFPSQGMVLIDNEYMTYSGFGTKANECGGHAPATGQGCFTGLVRGFLVTRPALPHAVGAPVDGRVNTADTLGGCSSFCGNIHAVTLRTGANAQLVDPTNLKPTIDVVGVRDSAAPGPNHVGSCPTIFATPSNPYYNGTTVDLTPSKTSYTCTATAPDGTTGQLSWNDTTKELKVRGVVFVPSNVMITQHLFYTTFDSGAPYASAALYIAGTLNYSGANICSLREAGRTDCDTRLWDPNVNSELAIIMPNLPSQTGVATNPSHTITANNSAQFQGFIYTDGVINRAGGNGFLSGTMYAAAMNFQGGASTAPAPGVFKLPTGVHGTPHVTTTYSTTSESTSVPVETQRSSTNTTTVSVTTTHATTVTTPAATTPGDFGG